MESAVLRGVTCYTVNQYRYIATLLGVEVLINFLLAKATLEIAGHGQSVSKSVNHYDIISA